MAEWKERGYVPDSDDEGEAEFELPSLDGSKQEREHFGSDNKDHFLPGAEIQLGSSDEKQYHILPTYAETHELTPSDREEGLQEADNERAGSFSKDESVLQTCKSPNHDPDTTQLEERGRLVAERLQNEFQSGLEIVREALIGSFETVQAHSDKQSASSSPLSSVKSFSEQNNSEQRTPSSLSQSQHHFRGVSDVSQNHIPSVDYGTHLRRRNLRQRNPIQLYPYALEGARYQQELLAHGVKPVHLAGSFRQRTSEVLKTGNCDFDEYTSGDSLQDQTFMRQESSGPLQPVHNGVRNRRKKQPIETLASDDELPDLDAIIEGRHARLPQTVKRSKGGHDARRTAKILDRNTVFHAHDLPSDSIGFTLGGSPRDTVFHVPPSPTPTVSRHSSQSVEALPRPQPPKPSVRRKTPQALPTPDISSTAQHQTEIAPRFDDAADLSEASVGSSSTRSQSSSWQVDSQMLQLQRKTKGVLPASFFRLQRQQEDARRTQARRWFPSPERNLDVPGVAHSISRPPCHRTTSSRGSNNAVVVLDESSSDQDSLPGLPNDPATSRFRRRYDDVESLVDGDIEEDNDIDMMVPAQSRKRKPRDPRRKRQRRLSECGGGKHDQLRNEHVRRREDSHTHGELIHAYPGVQKRMRKTSKARVPSLGPLQAPGYTDLSRLEQPLFLRVAARRARSRQARARKSPSRKCIQLATSTSLYDAKNDLYNSRQAPRQRNSHTSLIAPVRKPRRAHQPPSPLPFPPGLKHAATPGSRSIHDLSGANPYTLREAPERSPSRRWNGDGVQQADLLSEKDHSHTLSNRSGTIEDPQFDNRERHPVGTSAQGHIQRRDRSGTGLLLSSTINSVKLRGAQFEGLGQVSARHRILNAFRSGSDFPHLDGPPDVDSEPPSHLPLDRHVNGLIADNTIQEAPTQMSSQRPRKRRRKRTPRKLDIGLLNSAWRPKASGEAANANDGNLDALSGVVLAGLGSPEFTVNNNFGVVPLQKGMCPNEQSLVSQGQLSQLINDLGNGRSLFRANSDLFTVARPSMAGSYRWGVFDDHVTQECSAWFAELRGCLDIQSMQDNRLPQDVKIGIPAAMTSLISYLSRHVYFNGHEGLITFAEDAVRVSSELAVQVQEGLKLSPRIVPAALLRYSALLLVLVFEIAWIVASASSNDRLQTDVCKTFKELALAITKVVIGGDRLANVVDLLGSGSGAIGIGHDFPEADALVVVNTLCKQIVIQIDIWDLITESLLSCIGSQPENLVTFRDYDLWWKGIFLALPLLELDASGLVQRRSSTPGWELVQRLITRFMSLFMPRRHNTGYSTKQYGQILIHRCLELVQLWGWQGGHTVIGTLFDAYGSNNMNELFGESPEHHFYLQSDIAPGSRVHVQNHDSGFHAFLGLVAQTALDCRKPDADPRLARRVLRSLSARLVPNKGEDLPRHRNPSISDTIALRNRFDLVLVMYCAMPTDMRPSIRFFQSLVDFRNAHQEACKLAVYSWLQLVQHAILDASSIDSAGQENLGKDYHHILSSLSQWHDSIVMELLAEYALTSRDPSGPIENHPSDNAEAQHTFRISRTASADLLTRVLKASEQSFENCLTTRQATALFNQRMIGDILKLAADPESISIVSAALQIIRVYTRKCVPEATQAQLPDEDSQEYGSWDHFNTVVVSDQNGSIPDKDELAHLVDDVYPMLRRFVSNVFGSDAAPDHAILKQATDCWYEFADALVRIKARSWDDFIGQYSADSWQSFRHTKQSQQYKVYFLAKIVDSNYAFYENNRVYILSSWISALCRPNHLICWEHLLTSIILFHDGDNELLFNPPFAVHSDAGNRVEISKTEILERRMAMVYVVLRNMHRLLGAPFVPSLTSHSYDKSDFREILKSIEATLKNSYQDLGTDEDAQNDYRTLINYVVQQMQLYVVEFHKIDPFLTDAAVSSAEAHAITVALKRYSLTIQATGVSKAMVLFLYNASERAAIDDNQEQLILQLQNALLDLSQEAIEQVESHECDAAILTLLLRDVFPVYVGHAFSAAGHIIAGPILRILTYVFGNLRCRPDFWNPSFLQRCTDGTKNIFSSAVAAFDSCEASVILTSFGCLDNYNELVRLIHAAMLRIYEAAQAFPNEVDPGSLMETLLVLKDHIISVQPWPAIDSYDLDIQADPDVISSLPVECSAIRAYAEKELQSVLNQTWRRDISSGGWEIIGRGPPRMVKASRRPFSKAAAETEMKECQQRTSSVVGEFLEAFVQLDWWE